MRQIDDVPVTPLRQLALGALVLALTGLLSNLASFQASPGEAIADRLSVHVIARLNAVGYFAQMGTGIWLSVALILDVARGRRWAPVAWLVSLCLFLAPLPSLTADPALDPALLAVGAGIAILGRTLLAST